MQKNPPVGCPIFSYNGFMLEPLSNFLHHKLLSTLLEHPNHLPYYLCLLQSIETERFPSNYLLVSFDVESLYPNIPTQERLLALRDMLLHITSVLFSPEDVEFSVSAAELVLKSLFLEFKGSFLSIKNIIHSVHSNSILS